MVFEDCQKCGKHLASYDILSKTAQCLAIGCGHIQKVTDEYWEKLLYQGNVLSGSDRFTKYAHVENNWR